MAMLYDPIARRQAGRYVVVGLSGYALQVASFAALVHYAGLHYPLAGLLAGLLALASNFVLHRQWTLGAVDGAVGRQATSYAIISAVLFATQLAILATLVTAGMPHVPAEAISILAVVPANFLAQRRYSFGSAR
ncbi:MAG: GtrA family protein [Solirubrobacteraceae bacterium]